MHTIRDIHQDINIMRKAVFVWLNIGLLGMTFYIFAISLFRVVFTTYYKDNPSFFDYYLIGLIGISFCSLIFACYVYYIIQEKFASVELFVEQQLAKVV